MFRSRLASVLVLPTHCKMPRHKINGQCIPYIFVTVADVSGVYGIHCVWGSAVFTPHPLRSWLYAEIVVFHATRAWRHVWRPRNFTQDVGKRGYRKDDLVYLVGEGWYLCMKYTEAGCYDTKDVLNDVSCSTTPVVENGLLIALFTFGIWLHECFWKGKGILADQQPKQESDPLRCTSGGNWTLPELMPFGACNSSRRPHLRLLLLLPCQQIKIDNMPSPVPSALQNDILCN